MKKGKKYRWMVKFIDQNQESTINTGLIWGATTNPFSMIHPYQLKVDKRQIQSSFNMDTPILTVDTDFTVFSVSLP